jgi:queuine tRNA-ribosyltransferase
MAACDYEVVDTASGARAIRATALGEVMHPGVGPAEEAQRLYVSQSRLAEKLSAGRPGDAPLVLFDVGLGAASNAIAAWSAADSLPGTAMRLEMVSFERDLTPLRLALSAEEAPAFGLVGRKGAAAAALLATGEHQTSRVCWRLVAGELPGTLACGAKADIVFWDPFSPKANPTLWTVAAFEALRRSCADRCVLFTYSGSTATRSALLLAGWAVGVGVGIGAKVETTAAALDASDLARPLDRRWLARLERSSAPYPPDATPEALERIRAHRQFR